ncbi:hypothetical protein DFH07DRAFT_1017665 [Mycena maculata]|uniref:Uncharacterized protein n=1 Tax=Mycena maculata TaxID=230809 RepID=A0AAD7KCP7_9AGAR|nr:hypothetical protein DFH07DRAFT_1017665 [Mycena maculata]
MRNRHKRSKIGRLTDIASCFRSPISRTPHKMNFFSFFITLISSVLVKLGHLLLRDTTSNKGFMDLVYTVAVLSAELAGTQAAASELFDLSLDLQCWIIALAKEAETQKETAEHDRHIANDQAGTIELGTACVLSLLEEIAVSEARARISQFELIDENAVKEERIRSQASELKALREAHVAAQAQIATLEAVLRKSDLAHQVELSKVIRDNTARQLARAQDNEVQASKIEELSSTIDILKAGAAAALIEKAHQDARAATDAKEIRRKARKIKVLEAKIISMEKGAEEALVREGEQTKQLEEQATQIRALQDEVKQAKVVMKKGAAQALVKETKDTRQLDEQASYIRGLQAEVKQARADAMDRATTAIDEGLGLAEHIREVEIRALKAEERVASLQKEQVMATEKAERTIAELAARHAREVASTQVPPTIPHSTGGCAHPFTPAFVVRAQSAFAQASIAAPGNFGHIQSGRKIVRRGGSSQVTPLLLPAWPESRGRVEDARASKRLRRD